MYIFNDLSSDDTVDSIKMFDWSQSSIEIQVYGDGGATLSIQEDNDEEYNIPIAIVDLTKSACAKLYEFLKKHYE